MPHPELRHGWPVILACFLVAVHAWTYGFYGLSAYVIAFQAERGWSSARFWWIAAPFALIIMAQVGLVVHLVSILPPPLGAREIRENLRFAPKNPLSPKGLRHSHILCLRRRGDV